VLVVMRFETGDAGFAEQAREVLAILAARPGYLAGQLGRAYDDPNLWCLVTEWESVGSYRRALGSYEVKAGATPFLAGALPESSAFEPLVTAEPGGPVRVSGSDRSIASRP
jgi:heme oxygenase (mycobilin-producing)